MEPGWAGGGVGFSNQIKILCPAHGIFNPADPMNLRQMKTDTL